MSDHGWTHDGLMNDLASYLRGPEMMVWEDMQLGPSGSPRPDVYTIRKSYSKPLPAALSNARRAVESALNCLKTLEAPAWAA